MECSEEVMNNTSTNVMISGGSTGAAAGGMDWYVWLSRAGLDRATAYEYALVFAHNELDEDDIPHLDHAFLLSMGVSVGKHRLQILHLAQRDIINDHRRSRRPGPRPVVRLLSAAGRARSCLTRCLRSLASRGGRGAGYSSSTPAAALAAAQRDLYLGGSAGPGQYYWRSAVLKREKKLALLKQGRLTLTDGGIRVTAAAAPPVSSPPSSRSRSLSPLVMYGAGGLRRGEGEEVVGGVDVDKYFWGGVAGEEGEQEMRWDSMFGNLRPT